MCRGKIPINLVVGFCIRLSSSQVFGTIDWYAFFIQAQCGYMSATCVDDATEITELQQVKRICMFCTFGKLLIVEHL